MIDIVYDIDDVLNNLNEYVFSTLGLEKRLPKYFNINQNTDIYSPEEMEAILKMYGDYRTFRNLQLMPGGHHILDAERFGNVRVHIRSCCFTQEVAEEKKVWLAKNLPEIDESRVDLILASGEAKEAKESGDIIIEDCLINLLKYPRESKRILINKSYNQYDSYNVNGDLEGIYRVNNLRAAVTVVEVLAARMVKDKSDTKQEYS